MLAVTPDLLDTFAALVCAHLLADFIFQTDWMVRRKRNPLILLLHVAIHGAVTYALIGGLWPVALLAALSHLVIDIIKTYALPDRLLTYFGDQIAHLLALGAISLWLPGAFGLGSASGLIDPALYVLVSGAIASTLAAGPAMRLLMMRFPLPLDPATDTAKPTSTVGLPDAGRMIGLLERLLIFTLMMIDQPGAVGFLIAAKSVLRFDTVSQGRSASEYVIIGTLASFTWAILAAIATQGALALMLP